MSGTDPSKVFRDLGRLHGSVPRRYFVGREELESQLEGSVSGEELNPAWIYGPRRMGKTALARMIERRADGACVVWVDAIDVATFDDVLDRVVTRARDQYAINVNGETPRTRFETLVKTSAADQRLVIVFDEFDSVALGMSTPEQALLRRLKSEHPLLGYIFISCLKPTDLMEEVPDKHSRILGICQLPRVKPLEQRHVKQLCQQVAGELDIPALADDADAIWSAVGGFPAAVMRALRMLATARYHDPGLDREDVDEKLRHQLLPEVEVDLQGMWRSIRPGTRAFLRGEAEVEDCERDLREDGFHSRRSTSRATLLAEAGRRWEHTHRARDTTGDHAVVVDLLRLVGDLNEALRLQSRQVALRVNDHATQVWRLARTPVTEELLNDAYVRLYTQFYENARQLKGPDPKPYLLPEPLAKIYRSARVIEAIVKLRCTYGHDRTRETDDEKPNRHYAELGEIFEEHCRARQPTSHEQRREVRLGLLHTLCELLSDMIARVQRGEADDTV